MSSMWRRLSLPALRRPSTPSFTNSEDKTNTRPPCILEQLNTIQNSDQDLHVHLFSQFKQAVKCLDIPKELDSDDFYYLKWLRARGYDLDKAKEMLRKHLEWRETCPYLHGLINYFPPNEVLEQFKWKHIGNDSVGRPIICMLAGRVDFHYLLTNDYFEHTKRYVHKIFEKFQGISDEQRRLTGYGKVIGIVDMTGFTFAKAMSIELIQFGIYLARIFEANYPESLYRGFVINGNWFVTTVYNAVKPFLAQQTIDKVQIYGYEQEKYLPALETTIPIELIPQEYGGTGDSILDFHQTP